MFDRYFIDTNKALNVAIEELQTSQTLSIDTETTGLDVHSDQLALIQIACEDINKTFIIDPFKITDTNVFRDLLLNPNICKLNFNGSFDSKFFLRYCNAFIENPIDLFLGAILLKEYGPPYGTPYDARDVKLIAHLKGMPIFDGAFGLKNVLKVFCDVDISKEQQTSDWSRRPLSDVQLDYASEDVEPLFALGDRIAEEIEAVGMTDTWAVENACQFVTASMAFWGIYAEPEYFAKLRSDIKSKIKACEGAIGNFPEFREEQQDIYALQSGFYSTINMSSPLQVKAALSKRWGFNVETTAANELKKEWKRDPELIELITDRASLKSMLGNSCDGIINAIKESTGRVHSDFMQNGSPQHRYKSSHPILLNLPKKSKYGPYVLNPASIMYGELNFRDGFKPTEGCLFAKADYAQLQLRAIAQESGDPILLRAFNEGLDPHTITGSFIFDLPENVTKEELGKAKRDLSKTVNFAVAFLCNADTLRKTLVKDLGVQKTEEECQVFIDKYLRRYRGIAAYHKSQPNIVKRAGMVRVRGGRATLLTPEANVQTEAINFVMAMLEQSGIKKAMSRLARAFWYLSQATGEICRIVLSVFDEILVECSHSLVLYVKQILEREMVRSMKDYIYKVPVVAESAVASCWGGSDLTQKIIDQVDLSEIISEYNNAEFFKYDFGYLDSIAYPYQMAT